MSDLGDLVIHDYVGDHHIGFDGHGGYHGQGGTELVGQLLGIMGHSGSGEHLGGDGLHGAIPGLHHGGTDPSHFNSADLKSPGFLKNVLWSQLLRGITFGPAMFYVALFAFFSLSATGIYFVRHWELKANMEAAMKEKGAPTQPGSIDSFLVHRSRYAAPITMPMSSAQFSAGSAQAVPAAPPANEAPSPNFGSPVSDEEKAAEISHLSSNNLPKTASTNGTLPSALNYQRGYNGTYYVPYQSGNATRLKMVVTH
jgi:hypothetical protein